MKLTKKDFHCWGNGDKYDDELIIEHNPKIHSRDIADQILNNQEAIQNLKKFLKRVGKMEQMEYNYMTWEDELQKILGEKNG